MKTKKENETDSSPIANLSFFLSAVIICAFASICLLDMIWSGSVLTLGAVFFLISIFLLGAMLYQTKNIFIGVGVVAFFILVAALGVALGL